MYLYRVVDKEDNTVNFLLANTSGRTASWQIHLTGRLQIGQMAKTGSLGRYQRTLTEVQLLLTCNCCRHINWVTAIEGSIGIPGYAVLYRKKAAQLQPTIQHKYWDPATKLYTDTEDKTLYSQHTNALAILTGMVKKADMPELCKQLLTDTSLTQCTGFSKIRIEPHLQIPHPGGKVAVGHTLDKNKWNIRIKFLPKDIRNI